MRSRVFSIYGSILFAVSHIHTRAVDFSGVAAKFTVVFSDLHSTQWDRLFCWDHRVAKTECHGHQFSCGKSAVIV